MLGDINKMNRLNNTVYRRKNIESCTHQGLFSYSMSKLTLCQPETSKSGWFLLVAILNLSGAKRFCLN
jgi:hypothetical protein